jgi:mono/diheme cytochrome c family protein
MTKLLIPVVAVAALLLPAAAFGQGKGNDAKEGKTVFMNYNCYACHGFSGQNGQGMRLVPMKMTKENFISRVRKPAQPNRMPPYSAKVLTDEQAGDIWAYIKTLPTSPDAKDIPLLQEILKENK